MIISAENYFSKEANWEYLGSTQLKDFQSCEARALAKLKGKYEEPESTAFIQGKILDAWNDGCLDQFLASRPDLVSTRGATAGALKSDYSFIGDVISFIEKDRLLMESLSGIKQQIFTAEMFGTKWKIKIDSYFPREGQLQGRIVDLKFLKDLNSFIWVKDQDGFANREHSLEAYGYFDQIAIYTAIEYLANRKGQTVKIGDVRYPDYYEPFLTIVTKEKPWPNKEIISFNCEGQSYHEFIEYRLSTIKSKVERIINVKNGTVEPKRCNACDYCYMTKVLTGTTHYTKFAS